jgi:type II restriction/modification system DNA methylase subunit YeeA
MAETVKKAKAPAKPKKSTAKAKTAPTEMQPRDVSHDEIAQRARKIWADRGYRDGFAEQDWLEAEHQLKIAS